MTILDSFVLGVVEGITEFLPISSTGHLILTSSLLNISQTEFVKSFEIAIQLGAICSVIALYWRSFLNVVVLRRIMLAFLPTAFIGAIFYRWLKTFLLGNELIVVFALLLGGVALIAFEYLHSEQIDASDSLMTISDRQAIAVGFFQAMAIIPGVSRSAASILGGLLMGIKRSVIVEFSFLLAVPTMLAATGFDLIRTSAAFTGEDLIYLCIGFITAFIVALLSIRFLLTFIRNHSFVPFGIYRIVIACLFFFVILY